MKLPKQQKDHQMNIEEKLRTLIKNADAINLDKTSSSVKVDRTFMQPAKINRTILSPYTAPQTKILFFNTDQMTAEKKLELSRVTLGKMFL